MAHRFCWPDWGGSDGASVTAGQPVNGVSGPTWPQSGTVYKTLAATYATGGHTIWLPHGYRLTPPANGVWCNLLNAIDAASGELIIRAYDAGLGARDPGAEGAARARIRAAAYRFIESEFRAGAADCWAAMKWPVIDFGYYMTAGEWTHIGSNVWRAIVPWVKTADGEPGVNLLKIGARAPTNRAADIVWGRVEQQAYTQGQMSLAPNYQSDEGTGIWHSYRSDAAGVASAPGAYTTILMVTGGSSAAYNPVTYHAGVMLIGTQIAEHAIRVRNGGAVDIEDLCVAHARTTIRFGKYTNTTLNGTSAFVRGHSVCASDRHFYINSGSTSVAHCGNITLTDCSFDFQTHDDCTFNTDESIEPRSLAGCEGFSLEQRASNVLISGGWGMGGGHNALSIQHSTGTDADEPNSCTVQNVSLMGSAGAQERLSSLNGHSNVFDGVWEFRGRTRGQHSCSGGSPGLRNVIKNHRAGGYLPHPINPSEAWTIAHLFSSTGTATPPGNNGTIQYINCLYDTSNGNNRYGVMLADAAARQDWIGPNGLILEGVTLRVSPTQECALRLSEREWDKTATVTFDTGTDRVTWTAHDFKAPAAVRFSTTGTLPTGITAGTTYYIRDVTTNDFKLSATPNGTAIDLTGTPSGTHTGNSTQVDRSQTFKHLRIVQESGASVPELLVQEDSSAGLTDHQTFTTLAAHFNGPTAVHHKVVQGTAAQYDSGGGKGMCEPTLEPMPTPLAGGYRPR